MLDSDECATLLMVIRALLIIVSFSHNCSVIMDYLLTKIACKFFLFYTTLVVAIQAFNPKLKPDKNGIYIFDNANIEEGIKELDSVLVAFYSPKCRSCLEAESELEKVVKILSAKEVDVRVAKADVSRDKDQSKTSLGDRYQLQKLPTLMFFVADGIVKYQGRFPKNVVAQYLTSHWTPGMSEGLKIWGASSNVGGMFCPPWLSNRFFLNLEGVRPHLPSGSGITAHLQQQASDGSMIMSSVLVWNL